MIDVQTISILATSTGVMVALIYYAFQVRHQTKLGQTDLVMRLNSEWVDWELEKGVTTLISMVKKLKTYDEYREYSRDMWESVDHPEIRAVSRVAKFFDTVGILLQRRLIDLGMVEEMFRTDIKLVWEYYSPILSGVRKDGMGATFRKNFEYLYNEVIKREQQLASQTA